jgi:hypothetical protein
MARKTSLKESTRRKGQLRIDQQRALRRARAADPGSALRDDEILLRLKKVKAKKRKKKKKIDPNSVVREGEVNTVGGVARLLRKKRKQREAIFE